MICSPGLSMSLVIKTYPVQLPPMSIEIIILSLFFLTLAGIALFYRKSTLDKLEPLPGEKVLWEESGVDVTQVGAPRTAFFHSCVVRLTDRRVIIAQKVPLTRKTHYLRAVIDHSSPNPDTDLGATLRRGYLSFSVGENEIELSPAPRGLTVNIYIPHSTLTRRQHLEFTLRHGDEYYRLFGK